MGTASHNVDFGASAGRCDRQPRRRRTQWLVFSISAALLTLGCVGSERGPRMERGTIDLSTWDFREQGSVALIGDWEVCWGQFVDPATATCPGRGWQPFPVPRLWSDAGVSTPIGGDGIATYRAVLTLPSDDGARSLRAGSPMTAYRLWINGERVGGVGTVGKTGETTVSRLANRTYRMPEDASRVELLVHVANFDFRGGGLRRSWKVGLDSALTEAAGYELLRYAAFATMSVVVGLIFLVQFAFRRSDVARGWFAVATMLIGLRVVFANTSDLHQLLTGWGSFGLMIRLEYLNTALIIATGFGYFGAKLSGVIPPRMTRGVQLAALALVPIHGFAPLDWVLGTLPIIQALAIVASALAMGCWARATLRRVPGAASTLAAGVAFGLGVVHDVVRTRTGLGAPIEIFPFFVIVWMALESHALMRSFARSFASVERRSGELEDSNFELQESEEAVVRFLPVDFLRALGKETVSDVFAGDHAELEMTVMDCHIADAATRQAPVAFEDINEFFQRAEPVVRSHDGFLSQPYGDRIVALFPNDPREALAAALEVQQVVRESGLGETVALSIGMATGPVVLGTVGTGQRLSSIVLGPTTALARRIEEAARGLGRGILVSAATHRRVAAAAWFSLAPVGPLPANADGETGALFALEAPRERTIPAEA